MISINKIKPNIIVNACAKTNIDWCSANPKTSYSLNVGLAEKLASISNNMGIYFVQISSDHLFLVKLNLNRKHKKTH